MTAREREGSLASPGCNASNLTRGPLIPANPMFLGVSAAVPHAICNLGQSNGFVAVQ